MLLRKHLLNYKLVSCETYGLDRVLMHSFEGINELGDSDNVSLVVELMGRFNNIVLIREDMTIIDSIKRVDFETSSVRQILPGKKFEFLPGRDRLNIIECDIGAAIEKISADLRKGAYKALMESLEGFSPLVCRQILKRIGVDEKAVELSDETLEKLKLELLNIRNTICSGADKLYVLKDGDMIPREFSFLDFTDVPEGYTVCEYSSPSSLLEEFYREKSRVGRLLQYTGDILKNIEIKIGRISRKLELQKEELRECAEKDEMRKKGELLTANIYNIKKGDGDALVDDYYRDPPVKIKIALDRRLSPSENAQKYFKEYSKLCEREKKLGSLINEEKRELIYLESVKEEILRSESLDDVSEIKEELQKEGYIRRRGADRGKPKAIKAEGFEKHVSPSGFEILRGRNNLQNDLLTLKSSQKSDLWFHTHNIPGSHVVIKTNGLEPDDETILFAAKLAAKNSGASLASKVPVDYTHIKNVKKPQGAKSGMVIYESYKTLFVDPTK
jgi:predicted ribosome quality control (RQC) complex YloA/Tae2 family protein